MARATFCNNCQSWHDPLLGRCPPEERRIYDPPTRQQADELTRSRSDKGKSVSDKPNAAPDKGKAKIVKQPVKRRAAPARTAAARKKAPPKPLPPTVKKGADVFAAGDVDAKPPTNRPGPETDLTEESVHELMTKLSETPNAVVHPTKVVPAWHPEMLARRIMALETAIGMLSDKVDALEEAEENRKKAARERQQKHRQGKSAS